MANESKPNVTSGRCPACGRGMPANAPGGQCPSCLLRRGIDLASRGGGRLGDFIPPEPEELAILFPEFQILELIGRGGMGAVYKAVQSDLDRTVAIKLLPPETARDPEFMERFRREATTLARLDHPGIVRLFDYGQRDDFAFFVMEFVDGVDLARRLDDGPMAPGEVLAVASQLCDALQHSHERGVVHRDIKPANVLIARDGQVKLADFGLARLVHPEAGDLALTQTHARMGTPRYMAPEQIRGDKNTDHRVDVYALGVVIYEMLTAQLPVGHFDPPSEKVPALTPRLDDLVLRALHAEPDRRFVSMAEVKAGLQEVMTNPGLTRPERRRRLMSLALGASILAAVLGGGGAFLWSRLGRTSGPTDVDPNATRSPTLLPSGKLTVLGGHPCPFANQPMAAVSLSSAKNEFGVVLFPDGTVGAWGDNRFGQTNVPTGLRDVIAVSAGQGPKSAHALALRADGTVVGWGDNTFGQSSPPAGLSHVTAIAAGEFHSLALTRDGKVHAWGSRGSPAVTVPGLGSPTTAIAAGSDFSVALMADGRVRAWGLNDVGQCDVPPVAEAIAGIAAGSRHVVARLANGGVLAWGDTGGMQYAVPEKLPAMERVAAGGDGSGAVDASGRLYLWGAVPSAARAFSGRADRVAIGSAGVAIVEPVAGVGTR